MALTVHFKPYEEKLLPMAAMIHGLNVPEMKLPKNVAALGSFLELDGSVIVKVSLNEKDLLFAVDMCSDLSNLCRLKMKYDFTCDRDWEIEQMAAAAYLLRLATDALSSPIPRDRKLTIVYHEEKDSE